MSDQTLLLGHSPDADDAFMFWALNQQRIATGRWRFEHVLHDIQTLNERALRGELHITAISIHAYPHIHERYAMLNCGASMGDRYGPLVVARRPMALQDLRDKLILIPGEMTTAFLVLNLALGQGVFKHRAVRFDQIMQQVVEGQADAGLIIHEGQLTYRDQRLEKIVDLGEWWHQQTQLPLPLGGLCIRRDLGGQDSLEIAEILHHSFEYGLSHRGEAIEYCLRYARDLSADLADRFVSMYVNRQTLDYGEVGRRAVRELLDRGAAAGLLPHCQPIEFIGA